MTDRIRDMLYGIPPETAVRKRGVVGAFGVIQCYAGSDRYIVEVDGESDKYQLWHADDMELAPEPKD